MKDLVRLWNHLVGGTYDVVNTNTRYRNNSVKEKPNGNKNKKNDCRSFITLIIIGIISTMLGVSVYLIDPYNLIFEFKLRFTDGGEIFEIWKAPPVDLYLRIFLWNITNKDAFLNGDDEKIKVQEVGPYVYKELMSHNNITFNNNGTISVIPNHPLVFVPELSEGRLENDSLILPNIALLSIAHVVSNRSYFTRLGLNMLIRQTDQQPLVEMTAREFMFNYTNALMALGNKFLPDWITFENLGLIDRMYDFDGDFETVHTGERDIKKAGLIDMWRGSTKIPQWENPCGNVRDASDGTKFPSYIEPEDRLLFYRKSMCRAKYLVKVNETIKSGFTSYVYKFEEDTYEKEKCFCYEKDKCLPKGLLDVHGCYYGFPIALSAPHFLNNDPILGAKAEGFNPDPEKHNSYFVIEPKSGLPSELKANFQINMALGNIKNIAHVEQFSEMILPLLWAEFRMYDLPTNLKMKFLLYLRILPVFTDAIMYGSFFMGILILILSLYKLKAVRKKYNQKLPCIQNVDYVDDEFPNYALEKELSITVDGDDSETYFNSVMIPLTRSL